MANTKSAARAARQSERHRLHNKYYAKTTRNAIRDLRNTTDKAAATELAPKVYAMIDKLAKIGVIHKNKAANLKSGLQVYINKLAEELVFLSGCSAVGSALRSGRRGRSFESSHPDHLKARRSGPAFFVVGTY